MSFLTDSQLVSIGFKYIGKNVKISDKCSIYGASNIEIFDESRIDDFCILSAGTGGIKIGRYVHIASYCSLIGQELIEMQDFSGLSSRVSLYSSSDDYSGLAMTNPCIPQEYTNVYSGKVLLEKHVIIGVGSAILPNVTIGFGSAVGAFSLVTKNVKAMSIVSGVPVKYLKGRKDGFIEKEKLLLQTIQKG